MSGHKKHTNPVLILLCVLLCLSSGVLFTQSSANPLPAELQRMPDSIVAKEPDDSLFLPGGSPTQSASQDVFTSSENTPVPETDPEPTEAPAVTPEEDEEEEDVSFEVSPEAGTGVWTASGSSWMFLVNGTPYTGWLTDTDGKRYFFNKKGIMKTGWLERGGKRYYLDLDGIMQTGETVIDGKTYVFLKDGSLKGYSSSKKSSQDESSGNSDEKSDKNSDEDSDEQSQKNSSDDSDKKSQKDSSDDSSAASLGYVALTFDDGPSSFTDRLLDCLELNNAKATFFMVGKEIESFPDVLQRMESLGCELGNHSYSHQDLTQLDSSGISDELTRTNHLIAEQTGHEATVIRPPYGAVSDAVSASVSVPLILWSIDTLDWESQDPKQVVDIVMDEVTDGSVILMHDIFSTSVDAAEILIPRLIKKGYQLVTIHELAGAHGVELTAGSVYGDIDGR